MKLLRRRFEMLTLALLMWGALPGKSVPPAAATGSVCECTSVPDSCCESPPAFSDTAFTNHFKGRVLVGTREYEVDGSGNPATEYEVTVFDISNISNPIPPEDTNWKPLNRYHGPAVARWTLTNLGSVFGLTLDGFGNIFVAATTCYGQDKVGPGGNGGDVWRIDHITGAITKFISLPNTLTNPTTFIGLGNITFDCTHTPGPQPNNGQGQFFVTDMEDGRIYRIHSSNAFNASPATIDEYYDPGIPDAGSPGYAPLGERLWGVQWHNNRVFYSVWDTHFQTSVSGTNTIHSVGLVANGAFNWWDDRLEVQVPSYPGTPGQSGPVSDISFGPAGQMELAERMMQGDSYGYAHSTRVLEYICQKGDWIPGNAYGIGAYSNRTNSAGGVDYDFATYDGPMPPGAALPGLGGSKGRLWATADAIHLGGPYTDIIYGIQGLRPVTSDNTTSLLIDFSGFNNGDKTRIGDVEVPCPPAGGGGTGKICGTKFLDVDGNGVKGPGEPGLAGWTIILTIGSPSITVVTDASGSYCFTGLSPGTYTITEVTKPDYILVAPPNGSHTVTLAAGTNALGKDFANKRCAPVPCVKPISNMVSWWPLDEPSPSASNDIMGPNPATWFGGPTVNLGQYVGNSLGFVNGYVEVNTNNGSLDFGTGNFSIDAWVRATQSNATRAIVDKRTKIGTNPAQGYEFFIRQDQLGFGFSAGAGYLEMWPLGPVLPSSTGPGWDHVAVTLNRSSTPTQVVVYVNGVAYPQTTFAIVNSVSNTAKLRIGRSTVVAEQAPFEGSIDEVEIFCRALTASEIGSIYNARDHGKCKKYCYLPSVRTFGKNETSMTMCFVICNKDYTNTQKSFTWTLAGLPASAPTCTVDGPTGFSQSSGTISVPPGTCSPPICVVIQRPATLSPGGTACYQLTVENTGSGACFSCVGKLRASGKFGPLDPGGPVSVPYGGTASVSFPVRNDGTTGPLSFRLDGQSTDGDSASRVISLNGLPPGTPVTAVRAVGADSTTNIAVIVAYPLKYIAFPIQEVVLSFDLQDGTGQLTEAEAIGVMAEQVVTVAVRKDGGKVELDRAIGYPNPFDGSTGVGFSLPSAQEVRIGVFDLSGRLVRSLQSGRMAAGTHYISWDGRDARGERAGTGIYFIRVHSGERTVSTKVVRVK